MMCGRFCSLISRRRAAAALAAPLMARPMQTDAAPTEFEALEAVRSAQALHGVRHGDFTRYRRYCSRRTARLLKSLGAQQHGGRGKYVKRGLSGAAGGEEEASEGKVDARQLLVLLANAERAWAYAMEIKGEAQGAPRAVGRHAASRMRRAAAWAAELAKRAAAAVARGIVQRRVALECEAYHRHLAGLAAMEAAAPDWTAALAQFRRARAALAEAEALGGGGDAAQRCRQFAAEMEPSMQFCEYKGGDASGPEPVLTLPGAAPATSPAEDEAAGAPVTLVWRNASHTLEAGAARAAAARAEEAAAALAADADGDSEDEEARMEKWDALLMAYSDAQAAARGAGLEEGLQMCLQGLYLEASIARSEELTAAMLARWEASPECAGKLVTKKDGKAVRQVRMADVVHLLETVSATTRQLAEVARDDQVLGAECVAAEAVCSARRGVCLARAHAAAGRLAEAECLLEFAVENAGRAHQLFERLDESGNMVESAHSRRVRVELQAVDAAARAQRCAVRACAAAAAAGTQRAAERSLAGLGLSAAGSDTCKAPLEESTAASEFASYVSQAAGTAGADGGVASIPPQLAPVAARPIVFDIAAQHIDYPDMSQFQPKEQAGGVVGFTKSLFGWGSK